MKKVSYLAFLLIAALVVTGCTSQEVAPADDTMMYDETYEGDESMMYDDTLMEGEELPVEDGIMLDEAVDENGVPYPTPET